LKILIVLVVAVALGATFATVVLGSRMKEATVVANPYEEGLRYDQRRHEAERSTTSKPPLPAERGEGGGAGPATPAGDSLTLEISPQPPRAMTDLVFTVRASRDARPLDAEVSIALSMPGMRMMENRVALAPAGAGVYRGKGAVVRCPSGDRAWAADVTATPRGGGPPLTRRFTFEVAEGAAP
jgi:nitrogen fixation protein FixH